MIGLARGTLDVSGYRLDAPQQVIELVIFGLQVSLPLLTHLFIEGVSNRRDFIYVRAFAGVSKHVLGLLPEISALVVSGVPQSMIFNPCRIHVARRIPHGLETVGNACVHVA